MTDIDLITIQQLCEKGSIHWTAHAVMRMQERGIHPSDVKSCIMTGDIIEHYPTDYPHPSCLILGFTVKGKILHTVVGVTDDALFFITAYFPSLDKWNADLKTRKEQL